MNTLLYNYALAKYQLKLFIFITPVSYDQNINIYSFQYYGILHSNFQGTRTNIDKILLFIRYDEADNHQQ